MIILESVVSAALSIIRDAPGQEDRMAWLSMTFASRFDDYNDRLRGKCQNWRHEVSKSVVSGGTAKGASLCGQEQRFQCSHSEQKLSSPMSERDDLFSFAAESEVLSNFFERSAETLGGGKRAKTQHRIISLFDSAVILLDSPVEVRVAAMLALRAKYFPDRTWKRIVAVGG